VKTPTRAEIGATIRSFVQDHFLVEHGKDFDDATNLFETQIIDSFGFVELVRFLESDFKIRIQESDLVSGELTSINGMTGLVEKRTYEGIHA
jgi:D-alanine--poly(phosphoribitol) ligase subunit 2